VSDKAYDATIEATVKFYSELEKKILWKCSC